MLKKLCDKCNKEMSLGDYNYEEQSFSININKSNDEMITFSGDLCEDCENEIINTITELLEKNGIKKELDEVEIVAVDEEETEI